MSNRIAELERLVAYQADIIARLQQRVWDLFKLLEKAGRPSRSRAPTVTGERL